jgi:hypothetical protein
VTLAVAGDFNGEELNAGDNARVIRTKRLISLGAHKSSHVEVLDGIVGVGVAESTPLLLALRGLRGIIVKVQDVKLRELLAEVSID